MSSRRSKNTTTETKTEAETEAEDAPVKTASKQQIAVKVVKKPIRKVSFAQWARARGIKLHHQRGMLAFVKNPNLPRSYEDWDKAFEDY